MNRGHPRGVEQADVYDPSIVFREAGNDMRKHRMLVPAALVAVTLLGACGSDGGDSKAKFADQLQGECRTIARGLRDIDTPAGDNLADFEAAAKDASKVYDTGLTALKKLKAPSNEASDFKDLQTNISDQVDVFDQIATAAKKEDAATIKTKVASLKKINKDNADLADSLDASSCAFKAVFVDVPTDTKPAKTTTTTTKATTTTAAPTTTEAPTTTAATTTAAPPITQTAGNKQVVPFAATLTPKGDYTFVDTDDATIEAIRAALSKGPLYDAQSGKISSVDVIDSAGTTITRAFLFVTDADALTPGTVEEAENLVSGGQPLTPATLGGINGKTFPDPSGVIVFVAADGDTLLVAAGVDNASLDQGLKDLIESLPT